MTSRRGTLAALVVCALAAAGGARAAGSELYGKPLRGLTAVPISEVKRSPERWSGKTIRVAGTAAGGSSAEVTLSEGGASLAVRADGFSLPEKLGGARVVAEGKLRDGALVATGVEVSR